MNILIQSKSNKRSFYTLGQVAVEFLIVFILATWIVFYIYNFAVTLVTTQIREYASFMVGRTIAASASDYQVMPTGDSAQTKFGRASLVLSQYNDEFTPLYQIQCSGLNQGRTAVLNGFRDIVPYVRVIDVSVGSNVGIACQFRADGLLPSNNKFPVASDVLQGSQISDNHCACSLGWSRNYNWNNCLNRNFSDVSSQYNSSLGTGNLTQMHNAGFFDNGC